MSEPFGVRLRKYRESKTTETGKKVSQDAAARIFQVSISTYVKWERGLHLPDFRSCNRIGEIWGELFQERV